MEEVVKALFAVEQPYEEQAMRLLGEMMKVLKAEDVEVEEEEE